MIKLVVSDIDGTLLKDGTDRVNPELFTIIRELKQRGITFVAASGRHHSSMRYVMAPVAEDILFLSDNGSVVQQGKKTLDCTCMPEQTARALVKQFRTYENSEIMLGTPTDVYLETDGKIRHLIETGYHGKAEVVPDLLDHCQNVTKLTIYWEYEIETLNDELQELFGKELNIAISGKVWVDCMNPDAGKGNALAHIQKLLGVTPAETMVFGDNCNDIGMLQQADYSYAVANAHPQLKAVARYETGAYWEDGVLRTIREMVL